MALSGGGASAYNAGGPLALYDLLGQKSQPISYAYSCSMSVLGEEDEEEQKDDLLRSDHSIPITSPPPPSQKEKGHEEEEHAPRQPELSESAPPQLDEPFTLPSQPPPREARPQITQRGTFPQTTAKRPNWQTIRFQTTPGRADKEQLEAWVSAWSEDIIDLGDETYCACADSSAAAAHSRPSSPPLTLSRDGSDPTAPIEKHAAQRPTPSSAISGSNSRIKGGASVSFLCHNCARQPSPAIIPDQDLVFPPASGAGKMALKCKLVWRKIVGSNRRRQSQSPDKKGRTTGDQDGRPVSTTPLSGAQGAYYDDGDVDDDDEVDVDRLSLSSKGDDNKAGADIAERQARLRRAQRLLRKGSMGMKEGEG